eukprot:2994146-Rhodomonas_salina.1
MERTDHSQLEIPSRRESARAVGWGKSRGVMVERQGEEGGSQGEEERAVGWNRSLEVMVEREGGREPWDG